eukprot:3886747-Pleurochrysis_carterae.AAC.2
MHACPYFLDLHVRFVFLNAESAKGGARDFRAAACGRSRYAQMPKSRKRAFMHTVVQLITPVGIERGTLSAIAPAFRPSSACVRPPARLCSRARVFLPVRACVCVRACVRAC